MYIKLKYECWIVWHCYKIWRIYRWKYLYWQPWFSNFRNWKKRTAYFIKKTHQTFWQYDIWTHQFTRRSCFDMSRVYLTQRSKIHNYDGSAFESSKLSNTLFNSLQSFNLKIFGYKEISTWIFHGALSKIVGMSCVTKSIA